MKVAILHTADALEPPVDPVLDQIEGALRESGHEARRIVINDKVEPVIESLADELRAIVGSEVYVELRRRVGRLGDGWFPQVQPGPKLVLIDFGQAKELEPAFKDVLVRFTPTLLNGNNAAMGLAFRELGFRTKKDDAEGYEQLGDAYVATEHLLISLATVESDARKILTDLEIPVDIVNKPGRGYSLIFRP